MGTLIALAVAALAAGALAADAAPWPLSTLFARGPVGVAGFTSAVASLLLSLAAIRQKHALAARLDRALGTEFATQLRVAARLSQIEHS
ncbi:MAG TPA: hypothetical protein VIV06_06615 [Candidatus Limnocylindrales bacterium]